MKKICFVINFRLKSPKLEDTTKFLSLKYFVLMGKKAIIERPLFVHSSLTLTLSTKLLKFYNLE